MSSKIEQIENRDYTFKSVNFYDDTIKNSERNRVKKKQKFIFINI